MNNVLMERMIDWEKILEEGGLDSEKKLEPF